MVRRLIQPLAHPILGQGHPLVRRLPGSLRRAGADHAAPRDQPLYHPQYLERRDPGGVTLGSILFSSIMYVMMAILFLYPGVALWLPSRMIGR
jgi:hypothetical protein